jgi:hypothetical protein
MRIVRSLLVLAVGAAGCVELPLLHDGAKAPAANAKPAPPAGPVTADQIQEANAYEVADALCRELERDAAEDRRQAEPSAAADKPARRP